jgi:glucose-6-phosphate 1-dehydrogenase
MSIAKPITTVPRDTDVGESQALENEYLQLRADAADRRSGTLGNPLRAGLEFHRTPEPCVMVIFGVTGDLTARKLMPALYDLAVGHPLPEGFSILGVSHRDWSDDQFREEMRQAVMASARSPVTDESWQLFAQGLFYVQGDFKDPSTYSLLDQRLTTIDEQRRTGGNRLFYLATSPSYFTPIITNLGSAGIAVRQDVFSDPGERWHRVVIEKPLGRDLGSARQLIQDMASVFSERQIYRIDHYLGKETVQNVLAFRFANILFEPVFNRSYVDHIQITAAESIGVEGRGGYYEEAGALRDMVQSHILQLLTVVAMEPPAYFDGNAVRDEKVKVLRSVKMPVGGEVAAETVRGQYVSGSSGGRPVPAYRSERGVEPGSKTDTFAALKLHIDNWRWADVPFYLRTGKRLPRRVTEIAIEFNRVPHLMFQNVANAANLDVAPNVLTIRIQPDEGIALRFAAKVPGATTRLRTVRMDFFYGSSFGEAGPDAYERLLLDAMLGDPTLFARRDEVETAWALMQPVIDAWEEGISPVHFYEAGTWGPSEANRLIERDGRQWRRP